MLKRWLAAEWYWFWHVDETSAERLIRWIRQYRHRRR
jgi:hypothetical protein